MNLLIISNLYPNALQPQRGVFNQQQFERLAKFCDITVISPLPWTPGWMPNPPVFAKVPEREIINGIEVYHPRHLVTPKWGRSFYGAWMYQAIKPVARRLFEKRSFDCLLATWAYPDVYAASRIAADFRKPLIAKVHGTDINVVAQMPAQRRLIKKGFDACDSVIAVTEALKVKIRDIGIAPEKIPVLPNGIDRKKFFSMDQAVCRQTLKLDASARHVLFIGNLTPIKGIVYLIEALSQLPENVHGHIVGGGELQAQLQSMIDGLNLSSRVKLYGKRPHQEIVQWMNAADVFCLPSLNEGCPNVVIEALACGTPVVASRVGGVPELLVNDDLGLMCPSKDSQALAQALMQALDKNWNKTVILKYAEAFDWDDNVQNLLNMIKTAVDRRQG